MTTSRQRRYLRREQRKAYRPVVALVWLDRNGGALALLEVCLVVKALEATGTDDGVDVGADLTASD